MMPLLTKVQVYAHDPDSGSIYVIILSNAQSPIRIQYGRHGPADALRIKQSPMPGIGSWGLAAFPAGDIRNGVWLCSYFPSQIDAIHSPGLATDPFDEYDAHFSGYWRLLDGTGNLSFQFSDGSYGVFGSGSALPTVYRHIVSNQQRQKVPFTFAERVPNPPSRFQGFFQQANAGTSFSLDASGNITVSGAVSSSIKLILGGTTLTISSDAAGQVTLALPAAETFNITQGGSPATDFVALVSKLVAAFNAHTHPGTGTPTTPWSTSTVNSTIIEISN